MELCHKKNDDNEITTQNLLMTYRPGKIQDSQFYLHYDQSWVQGARI